MHARNRHLHGYDLPRLASSHSALAPFLCERPDGALTVDFSDPAAVSALNTALLAADYSIEMSLPPGHLMPAVPGRADYVHLVADLLAEDGAGAVPTGSEVIGLDVGVGASGVYPLIGWKEYGWTFVGSDVSAGALEHCGGLARRNGMPLELRRQPDLHAVLHSVLLPTDRLTFTMCNPPFYSSAKEADDAAARKWRGLGKGRKGRSFAGRQNELFCDGGERSFVRRLVMESALPVHRESSLWYTSLVSAAKSLPAIRAALREARPTTVRELQIETSNKGMRVLAWSFQSKARRRRTLAGMRLS